MTRMIKFYNGLFGYLIIFKTFLSLKTWDDELFCQNLRLVLTRQLSKSLKTKLKLSEFFSSNAALTDSRSLYQIQFPKTPLFLRSIFSLSYFWKFFIILFKLRLENLILTNDKPCQTGCDFRATKLSISSWKSNPRLQMSERVKYAQLARIVYSSISQCLYRSQTS